MEYKDIIHDPKDLTSGKPDYTIEYKEILRMQRLNLENQLEMTRKMRWSAVTVEEF